jgi:hypothetical protein
MTDRAGADRGGRINISSADLDAPEVDARVAQLQAAREVPLVRAVGAPRQAGPAARGAWWRGSVPTLAVAGLLGGVAGWALAELIARPDDTTHWYGESSTVGTVVFVSLFATALGLLLGGWEGIQAHSWQKARRAMQQAGPVSLAGGAVGGFAAQKLFEPIIRDALRTALEQESEAQALATIKRALHLGRGVGFALAAAAIGLALGAASRSGRRAVNAAVGGLVGGFVGGFLFDYVADWLHTESGVLPRLVALGLCGAMVGAGIGLVEAVRKDHWLEILTGGMAGKQFILYHDRTVVGAAADADITLIKDPGIAGQHLSLHRSPRGLLAGALDSNHPMLINGVPAAQAVLGDGDQIQLGNTVLRYREKEPVVPVVGPIHG